MPLLILPRRVAPDFSIAYDRSKENLRRDIRMVDPEVPGHRA
jgi:hypothetical protein